MTIETSSEQIGLGPLRCPTCGAEQEWSETCRRCRSDLSLLVSLADAWLGCYRQALSALRAGRLAQSLELARRCHQLAANRRSGRLLAVCHLLNRNWSAALRMAGPLLDE